MSKQRTTLLENKRVEIEDGLRRWAAEHDVLSAGEKLSFDLRIENIPCVAGQVIDSKMKATLPAEKQPRVSGDSRESWNLTEEDWKRLGQLDWNNNEKKFLDLLYKRQNGPLNLSEITAQGIVWDKRKFVHRFNSTLRFADDYHISNKSGVYYKLGKPRPNSSSYAI